MSFDVRSGVSQAMMMRGECGFSFAAVAMAVRGPSPESVMCGRS